MKLADINNNMYDTRRTKNIYQYKYGDLIIPRAIFVVAGYTIFVCGCTVAMYRLHQTIESTGL